MGEGVGVSGDLRLVYTVTEAAELLGIGRSTAYELVARDELATVRLGSRVFVTRPTLTEILGFEPPLPGELDAARAALAAATPQARKPRSHRPRSTKPDPTQSRLPFKA